MKPYMSYWSGGYLKIPNEVTLNLHKICAFYIKKHFGEVHFFTDSQSLPFFKDIEFSSINLEFDNLPKEYGQVWSLSKLYAYKIIAQKGISFVHIDYDVILWKGFEERMKKAGVFAQCVEDNARHWYKVSQFEKNCPNLHLMSKARPIDAVNVGVIGGNDLEFLYKYSNSALELILDESNKDFWINYNGFPRSWHKAVISEQYYLAVCAEVFNRNIEMIFPDGWPKEPQDERIIKEKGYTHCMGLKHDSAFQQRIKLLVEKLEL